MSRRVATYTLVVSVVGVVGVGVAWMEMSRTAAVVPAPVAELGSGVRKQAAATSTVVGPVLPRSKPVRLEIPTIDVDSSMHEVGQQDDGSLEVPAPGPDYDKPAWYRHSPTPGSLGPSILLGHVDSAASGPSVFYRLGELQPKDLIEITRADGSIATFKVTEVRRFPKDDFPTELVYGNLNHAGLRILTCGGPFDEVSGHYEDNVVVFAHLLPSG